MFPGPSGAFGEAPARMPGSSFFAVPGKPVSRVVRAGCRSPGTKRLSR